MDALNDDFVTVADDTWLADIRATLAARWLLIAVVTLVAVIAAIVYLRGATYVYSAQLRVYAAPSTTGQPTSGGALGGLASLAGISAPGAESATPFRLYLEGVGAREVAERMARDRDLMRGIFANEYDPVTRSWRERRGFFGSLKRSVWDVLGLPVTPWRAPDAARLQAVIAKRVAVVQSVKSPLVSISFDHPDPKFAVRFLTVLGRTVDDYLRERQQERTRNNIAYLSEKLRGVTFAEQRQVLFNALSEQERQAMLANSLAPYAANPFGVATASLTPTKPKQLPLLLGGLIGGLIAGTALSLLLGRPRRRAPAMIESA